MTGYSYHLCQRILVDQAYLQSVAPSIQNHKEDKAHSISSMLYEFRSKLSDTKLSKVMRDSMNVLDFAILNDKNNLLIDLHGEEKYKALSKEDPFFDIEIMRIKEELLYGFYKRLIATKSANEYYVHHHSKPVFIEDSSYIKFDYSIFLIEAFDIDHDLSFELNREHVHCNITNPITGERQTLISNNIK